MKKFILFLLLSLCIVSCKNDRINGKIGVFERTDTKTITVVPKKEASYESKIRVHPASQRCVHLYFVIYTNKPIVYYSRYGSNFVIEKDDEDSTEIYSTTALIDMMYCKPINNER